MSCHVMLLQRGASPPGRKVTAAYGGDVPPKGANVTTTAYGGTYSMKHFIRTLPDMLAAAGPGRSRVCRDFTANAGRLRFVEFLRLALVD